MGVQKQRMLAGEWYVDDDPELASDRLRAMELLAEFNASLPGGGHQRSLLRRLLGSFGEDAEIRPPLQVDYGEYVFVGARSFVNCGAVFLDVAPIVIGDDVQIGPNVALLTPTHPLNADRRREKWESGRPIRIGDNSWLGGGAIVLPGVTIGANTVVGAGSVVTKDLPDHVVAVGNPARIIRR